MTCSWKSRFVHPLPPCARVAGLVAMLGAAPACAQHGIVLPEADWLWPRLQARITVQTAALSPLGAASLARAGDAAALRRVQGGALFGDFVFARPAFGSFRATSGVVLGSMAGAPAIGGEFGADLGGRVGVTLLDGLAASSAAADASALPYLGVGYSSPPLWGALSVTADVGAVAGRPTGLLVVGRALLGSQGLDLALREARVGPLVRLGVRYSF